VSAKTLKKIEACIFVITTCYKTTVIIIRGIYLKTLFISLLNVN